MTLKRLVTEKVADQKIFEKIRRELEVRAVDDPERERLQAEMNSVKSRMAARLK
jgi:cyanate lyase